jgi:DNA-binding CsgD family transcriptional regulator
MLTQVGCYAFLAQRAEMERAAAEALRLAGSDPDIVGGVWLIGRGMYALLQEDRERALQAFDRGMEVLHQAPTLPHPVRGLWALLRTVEDRQGEEAQREVRDSGVTLLPANAALVGYAEAVTLGRARDPQAAVTALQAADALIAGRPGIRSLRLLALRWVSQAALADGWGGPAGWLSEAAEHFASIGQERVAVACRGLLRRSGVAVPRRGRGEAEVPEAFRRVGVTSREVEVLALVAERLSNREISERLVLSPRTVEKHVERLMAKTSSASRTDLARLAEDLLQASRRGVEA